MEKKLIFKPNIQWKDQELWCGDLCLVVLNEKNELVKCEPKYASARLPFRSLADFLQQPLPEDIPLKDIIVQYYQCVFQYMRIECLDNENAFRFLMEWIPENECDPRVESYRIVKESDTEVKEPERHFLYVGDVCFAQLTGDGDGRWEFKANAFEQEFIEEAGCLLVEGRYLRFYGEPSDHKLAKDIYNNVLNRLSFSLHFE